MDLFLFLLLGVTFCCYGVAGRSSSHGGLDLEGRNRIQDKPAVNKILSSDTRYECVHIYKQPAFDHPLLKNHKIQMNPSFSTKRTTDETLSKTTLAEVEVLGRRCPEGMVPIERIESEHQDGRAFRDFKSGYPEEHSATINTLDPSSYHGGRALFSQWRPHVGDFQYSKSQIWVVNGVLNETNSIEAGWAVHPALYGDFRTHLTTYWTADGYQNTGCYNVRCSGFVQTHPLVYLGDNLPNISSPGVTFYLDVMLTQDQSTGNWWLNCPYDNPIGYWPKELFTNLASGASHARFGGATYSPPNRPAAVPMGNAVLPDVTSTPAANIQAIQIMNENYTMLFIDSVKNYVDLDDPKQCYGVKHISRGIIYGGPGGKC